MKANYKYSSAHVIMKKGEEGKGYFLLGDAQAPLNLQYLKEYEIGAIISIGFQTVPKKKHENINYHYLKLSDKKTQPIKEHFLKILGIIEEERQKHGVLIHCMHGVSRSASFTIAYTMMKKKLSFQQAKAFVKERRPNISPNSGFVEQLQEFSLILKEKQLKQV